MSDVVQGQPKGFSAAPKPLSALLDLLPTGVAHYLPIVDSAGLVQDFRLAYLNPAAQQLLSPPAATYRTQFVGKAAFASCHEAYVTGTPAQFDHDGLGAGRLRVHACRAEAGLLVSFSAVASPAPPSWRGLLAQAPVGVCLLAGPQHVVELVNEAGAAYLGATRARLLRQSIWKAQPALASQEFRALCQRAEQGETVVLQEPPCVVERTAAGPVASRYYQAIYQPWRNEQGATAGVLVLAMETTEQVLALQKLQAANQELREAKRRLTHTNEDLDNFIHAASHDMWAPIGNIEGLLAALRTDLALPAGEAQVPQLLDLMQEAVARFKRTIRNLTKVAQLQHATDQPAAPLSLAHLVQEVCLDLAPQFAATGGQLALDLDACPVLHFAEKNLRSIIYNLLSNGLKYRHPDRVPQLQVRCYNTGRYTVLAVQDNGLGLNASQQQRVFGLFQRLHDHVEGTGVGLYMVKKIIESAGGNIEVESQLGVGSTFLVYFPH
jgi:signal transduction histidine kinase